MNYKYITKILNVIKFSVKSTLSIAFISLQSLNAQSVSANKGLETSIYAGNLVWGATNAYLHYAYTPQKRDFEWGKLDAYHYSAANTSIQKASDVSFWACAVVSGLAALPLSQNSNSVDWRYANLLVQNTLLTANLTQTVKVLVGRKRPASWGSNDDYRSFFSGHSSLTASAAATSLWYAYSVPNAPQHAKVLGWSAAGLSILTGILRIEAGKHYPSDVLIGWGIGTGVALLNGYWHRPR
jgi:membrane-associated phospholipid phosphatase